MVTFLVGAIFGIGGLIFVRRFVREEIAYCKQESHGRQARAAAVVTFGDSEAEWYRRLGYAWKREKPWEE